MWSREELADRLTEGIFNGVNILEVEPPQNPFVDTRSKYCYSMFLSKDIFSYLCLTHKNNPSKLTSGTTLESVLSSKIMTTYTLPDISDAIESYKAGMSIREASEMYNVPPYSLQKVLSLNKITRKNLF